MYETPPLYIILHIVLGFISYKYPLLLFAFVLYQFLQYALHVRFFGFTWEIQSGNSLDYTMYKLAQFGLGLVLAML